MLKRTFLVITLGIMLISCGGGGGGDETSINVPNFSAPILPKEFIISGHTVYEVNENCEYTEIADIVQNCLELSDEDNLSGNNKYVYTYHAERPTIEAYAIDKVIIQKTRLIDGEITEEEISLEQLWGNPNGNYIDLNIIHNMSDAEICGEYEFDVRAVTTNGDTTPTYTHILNLANNCQSYPQEFIISGNAVYKYIETCEYTEIPEIIDNCLELADENNLSGNNIYFLTYLAEVPNVKEYVINRVYSQITRLNDGATSEWETDIIANPENKIPYINLIDDPFPIYNTAYCGEYELNVHAIDTNDRTTPAYTYKINVINNCITP